MTKKGEKHSEKSKRKMSLAHQNPSAETRRKMSLARKGKTPWNKGKKMSEEANRINSLGQKKRFATQKHPMQDRKHTEKSKEKNRIAHLGKKLTEEHKKKIGRKGKLNKNYGKHLSAETKKKLSVALKGRKFPESWHKKHKKQSERMKGKKRSAEFGRKVSLAKKGVKLSVKHKAKLSKAKNTPEAKKLSREIRAKLVFPKKDAKSTEKKLQHLLKKSRIRFQTHKSILGQPDVFIKPNICIFTDGNYWHANPKFYKPNSVIHKANISKNRKQVIAKDIWKKDKKITNKLTKDGYKVLRFWEIQDLKENPEKCIQKILNAIKKSK